MVRHLSEASQRHPLPRHPRLRGGRPFGDVFSRLDPEQFQRCFMQWTRAVADLMPWEVLAIDGKTARRSHGNGSGEEAIHLVIAWVSANTLTLGQVKAEGSPTKSPQYPGCWNCWN